MGCDVVVVGLITRLVVEDYINSIVEGYIDSIAEDYINSIVEGYRE